MKFKVWGIAAGAAIGAAAIGSSIARKADRAHSCTPIGTKPFQGVGLAVAGVGMISEGADGSYLLPFLSFDRTGGFSGTYQGMLWTGEAWKPLSVGAFHATNGVLQFLNVRGRWMGFTNRAAQSGGAQLPTMYIGDRQGVFGSPQEIGTFSNWGEFDSAAKSLSEDRVGITGRDRLGGGFTNVFAEKIGDGAWKSEPIKLDGKATPQGFSALIGYDAEDRPWIAYESLPGRPSNEASVLTRTDRGWESILISNREPVNLTGSYLPEAGGQGERIALVWTEKGPYQYAVKAGFLELADRRVTGVHEIARVDSKGGWQMAPVPAITVAHDGQRAAITLMNPRTHQGWTARLQGGEFEPLKPYAVPQGQGVIGFPQAFYSSCSDAPILLVGVGRPSQPGHPMELGAGLRIETLSER